MMFHVKPKTASHVAKGFAVILLLILQSCIGARATVQIPDYLLLPNGKEHLGGKPLTGFVFENNVRAKLPIEQFIAYKYKSANYFEREIWVTIDGERYQLIIYDAADFEKYFNSANFSPMNEEAKDERNSTRKFVAISMITDYNEDCLSDQSLLQNKSVKYLRDLKNEYINQ
ncbi:hypothetical protein [Flavobacterium caeni]|uniref:Lipoprotein n=1 Tax=Flavobacterium caeni TaxID=490189 RepID=A0A1G5JC90_9FLAO|nr:hypothetical protein [Flavobacterium caeni]SCY86013.1 hypothetical protein SAMN02927903_02643 [Flavobacterium caeni]